MGSSFVELKDKGFWARDAILREWLGCLVDEIDRWGAREGWLMDLRERLFREATVGMIGGIHPDLDKAIGSDEGRRAILIEITDSARKRLERGEFNRDKNTGGLAQVEDAILEHVTAVSALFARLLRGELQTDASSPLDYMRIPSSKQS